MKENKETHKPKKKVKIAGDSIMWTDLILDTKAKYTSLTTKNMRNNVKKYQVEDSFGSLGFVVCVGRTF